MNFNNNYYDVLKKDDDNDNYDGYGENNDEDLFNDNDYDYNPRKYDYESYQQSGYITNSSYNTDQYQNSIPESTSYLNTNSSYNTDQYQNSIPESTTYLNTNSSYNTDQYQNSIPESTTYLNTSSSYNTEQYQNSIPESTSYLNNNDNNNNVVNNDTDCQSKDLNKPVNSDTDDKTKNNESNEQKLSKECNTVTKDSEDDQKDIQNTSIYLILSGSKYSIFKDFNIISEKSRKSIKIVEQELIPIISNNENQLSEHFNKDNENVLKVQEYNNSFKDKGIYLFKANIELENDKENFKIEYIYGNELFQSKSSLKIQRYQQLFIFSLSYIVIDKKTKGLKKMVKKAKKYVSDLLNSESVNINDFIDEKYSLSNMQKFVIYREYLIKSNLDDLIQDLVEETKSNIINLKKIDFEYILIYIRTLLYKEEKIYLMSKEKKDLLSDILSNLIYKEKIEIRKYDDKYDDIVRNMEADMEAANISYYYNSNNFLREKYFFLLIYYQIFQNGKRFDELFQKIQKKKEVIEFIKRNKNIFSNLKPSNLKSIYEKADKNNTSINDVLLLTSNFNDYITLFTSMKKKIIESRQHIQFNKIPKPGDDANVNLLEPFINTLIEMYNNDLQLEEKDLNNIKELFSNLVKVFEGNNYEKLNELKNILEKYRTYDEIKLKINNVMDRLDNALHYTGKKYIENDLWNNMQILDYLQNDVKRFYREYKNNPEFAFLISHIKLDDIDENFCKKFFGNINDPYDYKRQFESNYNIFISSIVKNAYTYSHLAKLYNIFNIQRCPRQNQSIINNLVETFGKNLDRDGMEFSDIQIIVYQLYKLVSDNDDYCKNSIIKYTKRIFDEQEVNDLFVFILNTFSDELNDGIKEQLIRSITDISNDNVFDILSKINKESIVNMVVKKIKNKEIKEKDIFSITVSENLELLQNFIKSNYFQNMNDKFMKLEYVKKTFATVNNIIEKLEEFEFSMEQVEIMNQLYRTKRNNYSNDLRERFLILSLGDTKSKVITSLYGNIIKKISYCTDRSNKIDEIINIFSNYYPNEKKDVIEKYETLRENIMKSLVCDFPDESKLNEIGFDKLYHEAHQITKFKDSKIFIMIHENQKKKYDENDEIIENNDNIIFDKTKTEFLNLEKLFIPEKEKEIDLQFLEDIIQRLDNNEMEDELKVLYEIFGIKKTPKNRINEKLILLNNKNNNINLYKKVLLLLNDFPLKSSKVKEKFEEAKNGLENITSLEDLITINDSLNALELNILNVNSEDNIMAFAVIDKMYEEPKLMEFMKNKKIDDIRQMGEFIDDSEDIFLTIGDIDQLSTCMSFQQELKLKSQGKSEEELLNIFVDLITNKKNYRDIGLKFENSSGKFSDFNELYKNHLNPNELNKVHIRCIYNSSTIELINDYPKYNCEATYSNNKRKIKKDYDEILELRTIALLRKKDQKEEDYFEICSKFAEIINNIQDILKLLKTITSKGYFEDIEYTIHIEHGNALAFKKGSERDVGKDLNEVIKDLNDILVNQKTVVTNKYKLDPISRMVHGRQFSYIYDYKNQGNKRMIKKHRGLKKFNHNIRDNILKYITNNSINNFKVKNTQKDNILKCITNITKSISEDNNDISLNQMFDDVSTYLNELFNSNNKIYENIFKKALIKRGNYKRGIYSHSCSVENIERNLIYCSLCLTGEFPVAQTVLYCNDNTTEDEIISFIYRCVLCNQNVLFILIKPESLSREKKNLLIELLKELYSNDPKKMVSCLLFIYTEGNKTDEAIIEIKKLPYHKYYDYNKKYITKNKKIPNVKVYSSEFSGLGKSTLIKTDFSEEYPKYEYVYFQIGDDIKKNEIIERLLKLSGKKIALHLDLYYSEQIELISEFLFSFLVLKYYSLDESVFYYGNEMKIKIEIPNGNIDFKGLFPIFEFFDNEHITFDTMPKLITSLDVKSNLQIVCNYLNNINIINKKDIHIPDISFTTANSIDVVPIREEKCSEIIFSYLEKEKNNSNYYQIQSFINILAQQFILLSKSYYFNVEQLNTYYQYSRNSNLLDFRRFIIISLTKVIQPFITSTYNNIIKDQKLTYGQQKGRIDIKEAKETAALYLSEKETFSFDKIRPSLILINEDEQSVSIINTCKNTENSAEERNEVEYLKAVYQIDLTNRGKSLIDYKKLKTRDFLVEVKKVLNLFNPIDEKDKNSPREYGGKKLEYLSEIVKSYVFTADNFMKLILISLYLRTDTPVVLMGETGCGKTSLIRIIAKLKSIPMYTLNIHAGIEDDDIIQFIRENNLYNDPRKNKDMKTTDDMVLIFLDEINTCNSLGLITEIMLKRSCKGELLRNNIKIIAACNPYRVDVSKREMPGLLDEKYIVSNLVYSVNPLTHSLLNFVFDFGSPEDEDIGKYISNMVYEFLQKNIENEYILKMVQRIAEEAVFEAHIYIRDNFDISSVSLREIRRLGILFEWFCNDLLKNPYMKKTFNLSDERLYLYSLNLSIYLCYYIRLFDKNKRREFVRIMNKSFGHKIKFEEFPKKVENEIATAVKLEKGIARNKALLENLFVIFVCLNTKIPLFIIGKPGCSKSLSAQLIFKSMNGKNSSHPLFTSYPKVYTKSYQGSRTSTSQGILKIFEKARRSQEENSSSNNIISAIYFDEMGLAEVSKNNPLKVIHSQLEFDDNERKIGFIGISNWPFDASKMNRGIHLSIPEPDEQDLIDTALAIAESYDPRLKQNYKKYYEYVSSSYFKYKKVLRENPSEFEDRNETESDNDSQKNIKEFHGTRDFYHLIKTISKLFIQREFPSEKFEIDNILMESIERNFGGLDHSIEKFKRILKNFYSSVNDTSKYDVMNCIFNNIKDSKSRYLLVVTKSSISQYLITLILQEIGKNYVFYYGSNFDEDTSKGYYSAKILSKVQITMNEDNVMILKNLPSMYPSLYDLFNQNFRKIGNSSYARIALGNSNTQNYEVNDNFRCIILLDKNELDEQDPPFINRFEKHIITFKNLLDGKSIKLTSDIVNDINKFSNDRKIKSKIDISFELINCDLEEIRGITYQLLISDKEINTNENENEDENENEGNTMNSELIAKSLNPESPELITEKIYKKVVPTFSQDLLFYFKNSEYGQQHKKKYQRILNIYLECANQHQNIKSYLENITTNKHIIYTFSNILDSIFGMNNEISSINNETYGSFTKDNTRNVFINQYNSENEIDEYIIEYSKSNDKLCIIHFDVNDCKHLNHINYLIENYESTLMDGNNDKLKPIVLIVHVKRVTINNENKIENEEDQIQNEYLISHLTNWNQFFIDNLNGKIFNLNEIINASVIEIFKNKNLIDLDKEFDDTFYHSFTFLNYNEKINFTNIKKEEYIKNVCSIILNNKMLKGNILSLILNKIKSKKDNIIMEIFKKYNFEENDIDFTSVLIKHMKSIFKNALVGSLIQMENLNIFSTLLLNDKYMENKFFEKVYQDNIKELKEDSTLISQSISDRTDINLIFGITYPCIIPVFKEINKYINLKLKHDYFKNENSFTLEDKENYVKEKDILEMNIKDVFDKQYFAEIFLKEEVFNNVEKRELLQRLFKDYILYYISKSNKKFNNGNILKYFETLYKLFEMVNENEDKDRDEDDNEDGEYNDVKLSYEKMTKFIVYIEIYQKYIIIIVDFINLMDSLVPGFIDLFNSKILDKSFMKININISLGNDIIFNLFESIIYCILSIEYKFKHISDEIFNEFLEGVKNISDTVSQVNIDLGLTLKQILYLKDFISVTEAFRNSKLPLKENLETYLKIIKDENETYLIPEYLDNNTINLSSEVQDPIIKEFKFLEEKLPKETCLKLTVKLLNNKVKISNNEYYILKLLKIICSNNDLIIKSKKLFEVIFKKYNLEIINIKNNKSTIKKTTDKNNTNNTNNNTNKNKHENEYDNEEIDESEEMISDNSDIDDDDDDNIDNESSNGDSSTDESDDDNYDSYSEDDDDDNYYHKIGVKFISELNDDLYSPIIKFLNKTENVILDEVLISLFDEYIINYFDLNTNMDKVLFQSLDIFKTFVSAIEDHNSKITYNNKLEILYCISYIKCYSYNLCRIINDKDFEINYVKEIFEFLNNSSKFRKVIKIYILRVLNKIILMNYKGLLKFMNDKKVFNEDFDFSEKVPFSLNYLFLQKDSYENYKKLNNIYKESKMENFKSIDEIVSLLNNKSMILSFYDLIVNEEISNLLKKPFNKDYYQKLCSFLSKIFNKLNGSSISDNIISIFYNYNSLTRRISNIQKLSLEDYEILLYSHKFAFICSQSKPNTVYSNILSSNVMDNINRIYIPGGEPEYDIKMDSAKEIKERFNENNKEGAYICSCGKSYFIEDCSQPYVIGTCTFCKKEIGGSGHQLLQRDGHMRIFRNAEEQLTYRHIPGILLGDFIREVEALKNVQRRGIVRVLKVYFTNHKHEIRNNINNVTYRLLSFIFYSCILFDEKLKYINDSDITKFYYINDGNNTDNNQSIFSILKDIWNILNTELGIRGIENKIQCFLNIIIPNISTLIWNNTFKMESINERKQFETECNQMVENIISNFPIYYQEYINNSNSILNIQDNTIKSIIEETSNINNLSKENYPLIEYFYASDYPSRITFEEQFDALPNKSQQYPVIYSYNNAILKDGDKFKFLETFQLINPLIVYAIDKYSNKKSRKEAKEITIESEIENDVDMKKLFEHFEKGWEKVYNNLSNIDCHGELEEKIIGIKDPLAYILNDSYDDGFGKYIATYYKDCITHHNEFIKKLIPEKTEKDYLKSYLYQIEKRMVIQDANVNEIASLDINNDIYDSFDNLINTFSYRNFLIDNNGNINYTNYKSIKYDFDSIENELLSILLLGKRLLKDEKEQKFISYKFEGFTKNYNIISDFMSKIKDEEELSKEDSVNISNSMERYDYSLILDCLQSLFQYFYNKRNINGNENLLEEINQLPGSIIKLNSEFRRFINDNQLNLKLNQLIDLYDYVEQLNYGKIIKYVSKEANNKLDKNQKNILDKHFNQENLHISKEDFYRALQKLISRYLISDQFNHYDWDIFIMLSDKPELWNKKLTATEEYRIKFEKELESLKTSLETSQNEIKIGQAISFSKYLGLETMKKKKKTSSKSKKSTKKPTKTTKKFFDLDY